MSENPSNPTSKKNVFEDTFADGSMALYALLFFFGLITWGIAAFMWLQLYTWFAVITEPTIIFTLPALFLPYIFYSFYRNAASPGKYRQDPLEYIGNGDANNGVVMIFIFVFWSILYWNLIAETVNPLNVSIWGLMTIFGMFFLRSTLFREAGKAAGSQPSAGVSAPEKSKS
jgi:hypothetical protein